MQGTAIMNSERISFCPASCSVRPGRMDIHTSLPLNHNRQRNLLGPAAVSRKVQWRWSESGDAACPPPAPHTNTHYCPHPPLSLICHLRDARNSGSNCRLCWWGASTDRPRISRATLVNMNGTTINKGPETLNHMDPVQEELWNVKNKLNECSGPSKPLCQGKGV